MENTPRVNSARLSQFIGRDVRVVGKLKMVRADSAILETSDGGQIEVKLPAGQSNVVDDYVEVIGSATDNSTIKFKGCVNLGPELDMQLVNTTVELMHDPRFRDAFM